MCSVLGFQTLLGELTLGTLASSGGYIRVRRTKLVAPYRVHFAKNCLRDMASNNFIILTKKGGPGSDEIYEEVEIIRLIEKFSRILFSLI